MGHKKKKTHSKNYNKNSNKINITIHNEKAKTKRKRSTNKPKSGISSHLGQHVQTSTALYNAKEDQSDLVNQASNYTNHVKKQYNALLENVAAEARPRPPLQIQAAPPQENFLQSIMNGIVQRGGINVSFPKVENAHPVRQEAETIRQEAQQQRNNTLMGVLRQAEADIQATTHEREQEPENIGGLNATAVKRKAGRPAGSKNLAKVPMKVSSHMKTRGTTSALNEMAAATPAADEINPGGDEQHNNVDLNKKAVEVKKKAGRPKKEKASEPSLWTEADKIKNPLGYQLVQDYKATHK